MAEQSTKGSRGSDGGADPLRVDAKLHDDRLVHPVVLNTSLHQHLAATGGMKPSTLASALQALAGIRRQKRSDLGA